MYSAEEFLKSKNIEINRMNYKKNIENNIYNHVDILNKHSDSDNHELDEYINSTEYEKLKEFDKLKSKVLKYAVYKKRTEQEIRNKFSKEIAENILNDIIYVLKENSYIDDCNYIQKTIDEYIKLKNLSIQELKYKLLSKGLRSSLIDEYIANNKDILNDYEIKSAQELVRKKKKSLEDAEIRIYLLKKGYKEESIRKGLLK